MWIIVKLRNPVYQDVVFKEISYEILEVIHTRHVYTCLLGKAEYSSYVIFYFPILPIIG